MEERLPPHKDLVCQSREKVQILTTKLMLRLNINLNVLPLMICVLAVYSRFYIAHKLYHRERFVFR
jgi:hypothetical protein